MNENIRFIELLDELKERGLTTGYVAIAEQLGTNKAAISDIKACRKKISLELLRSLKSSYPKISLDWIITGEGEMFEPEITDVPVVNKRNIKGDLSKTRPRIPIDAAAGSLSFALSAVSENQCERYPIIPQFPKYDFTIIARGDSMEPELESGDELACLFVQESSFIQWGRVHILDTEQGVVVKRVFDKGDSILCKSTNPEYEPFKIPKREVYKMALVVGVIRRY